jgi:hypothetical protein
MWEFIFKNPYSKQDGNHWFSIHPVVKNLSSSKIHKTFQPNAIPNKNSKNSTRPLIKWIPAQHPALDQKL